MRDREGFPGQRRRRKKAAYTVQVSTENNGAAARISATATPGPMPGTPAPKGKRTNQPLAVTSVLGLGRPALTGQAAGLIALGTTILLTVTRLSVRRRSGFRKRGR